MKALAIKNWFKNKDGKPKNKALVIVEWVLFGIFGVIFAFVLAANISGMIHKKENYNHTIRFGVGCFYVLSESMEPDYMKGSAIITYKEDIEDVYQRFITTDNPKIDITFMNIDSGIVAKDYNDKYEYMELIKTDMVMTHRLIDAYINEDVAFGKGRYVFMTAGINPQSNTGQENQYQVFTEKQYLGVVRYNSDSLGGFLEFITSAGGLIVLLLIPAMYLIITSAIDISKALKESEEGVTASGEGPIEVDKLSEKDKERLKQELLQELLNSKGEDNHEKD